MSKSPSPARGGGVDEDGCATDGLESDTVTQSLMPRLMVGRFRQCQQPCFPSPVRWTACYITSLLNYARETRHLSIANAAVIAFVNYKLCLGQPPSSTRAVPIPVRSCLSPTLRSISQPSTDRTRSQGSLSPHPTKSNDNTLPGHRESVFTGTSAITHPTVVGNICRISSTYTQFPLSHLTEPFHLCWPVCDSTLVRDPSKNPGPPVQAPRPERKRQ
jgi:hypothetical protein